MASLTHRAHRTPASLPGIAIVVSLLLALVGGWPASALAETVVGNGQRATELRTPGEFQSIALSGGIDLKVTQADRVRVALHGDANLLPLVEVALDADQALRVRWKSGASVRTRLPMVVEVAAPRIAAVSTSGSGDVDIEAMKTPQLALSITGSGDVRAKALQHDELSVSISGSGDAKLAGQTTRLRISIAGSGDVDTVALPAADVTVNIAGSGDAAVAASRSLNVSIAGSGSVAYSGTPSVSQAIVGAGAVRKR